MTLAGHSDREHEKKPPVILIVDDVSANLKTLSEIMRKSGYQTRPAQSGELALKAAQADPPDLILLDILMPGMDGYEVCRRLKRAPRLRDIPVLFISALEEASQKTAAFEAGGVDYITKPFHKEEVLARVKIHLDIRALQLSLQHTNEEMEERVRQRTLDLAESEKRFRILVEEAPDAILVYDAESHRFVEVNAKAEQMFHRSRAELLSIGPEQLHAPVLPNGQTIAESVQENVCRVLKGESRTVERLILQPDGSEIICEVRLVRLPSQERNLIRASYMDITERKKVEQTLRRHSAFNNLITNLLAQFEIEDHANIEGHIRDCLQGIAEYFAVESAFLIQISPDMANWSVTLEWCISPDLSQKERFQRIPLGTFPWVEERILRGEFVLISHLNDLPPEAQSLRDYYESVGAHAALYLPLRGHRQGVRGCLGLLSISPRELQWVEEDIQRLQLLSDAVANVLERRRAEEKLQASEQHYRIVTETTGQIVYDRNMETGQVLWAGAIEPITGFTPEEFGNMDVEKWQELIHPDDVARVAQAWVETLRTGHRYHNEYRIRHKDGHYAEIEVNAVLIKDSQNGSLRMLGTIQDISEHKQAQRDRELLEEQFRQAQKMESIGRLAGGVAHDFNNLLTGMFGYLDLALEALKPQNAVRTTLLEARKSAERAATLTKQLLAFSRRQKVEPSVLNLNEVIEDLHNMLDRLLGEDVDLRILLPESLDPIRADRGQIEQILVNLCVNARDAMPDGGRIEIATADADLDEEFCKTHLEAQVGPHVLLTVRDTGCGMSEEVQKHLFEPFFTTKPVGKGTGLGLASIYGAVKQNDGLVEVESQPGHGTLFRIFFPKTREAPRQAVHSAAETSCILPRGHETILFVEDDTIVREFAALVLERLGYQVLVAANGQDALQTALQFPGEIHLLLTDVVLPGLNGHFLAQAITETRQLKVLFNSGYTPDVIEHYGILEEGVPFLGKPYSARQLAHKVRETLDT
jgi:PAS domain S-box-containing protein